MTEMQLIRSRRFLKKSNATKLVSLLVGFSLLLWVSVVLTGTNSDRLWAFLTKAESDALEKEEFLDDLLPKGFEAKSCLSRFESTKYRRGKQWQASPYLLSKLRSYEARHRRCGVYTESYNKTVQLLRSGGIYNSTADVEDCRYIVWISFEGLGNKMLTLASAFLYALLTDRVVLADRGVNIPDLFCEPFPEVSWFLPLDFPFTDQFSNFTQTSEWSYGNSVVKRNSIVPQPYIYLHLVHDYDDQDKLFYCDEDQAYLHSIPWLIMKSDVYIVPAFFLMPSFRGELSRLFPEKVTVFHLLGRYLFHPTNSVWDLITRYYETYLSKSDELIGIQVRAFNSNPGPFTYGQILTCTTREKILPQVSLKPKMKSNNTTTTNRVAILITSLSSSYFEKLRDLYYENPTTTGEVVGVFQPSHEMFQQSDKHGHNQKALAEIYMLSFTDKLITSGWSTFGYVAQSLGGLRPWILYRPFNDTQPDPPCRRALSIEPCFLSPSFYDCNAKRGFDPGAVVPHVKHCEDVSWGLKLV